MRLLASLSIIALLLAWRCCWQIHLATTQATHHLVGAFHVHSNHSHDSKLDLETIATAAKEAKLDFVVVTDHDNLPFFVQRLHHVTLLGGNEKTTAAGHLIEFAGLPIIAHPEDSKRPWNKRLMAEDARELKNTATTARLLLQLHQLPNLLFAATLLPFAPQRSLSALYQLGDHHFSNFQPNHHQLPLAFCGSDTHGWVNVAANLLSWVLVLEDQADAQDPETIFQALRQGHFYCAAGLLGVNPEIRMTTVNSLNHQVQLHVQLPNYTHSILFEIIDQNNHVVAQQSHLAEAGHFFTIAPGIYRWLLRAAIYPHSRPTQVPIAIGQWRWLH